MGALVVVQKVSTFQLIRLKFRNFSLPKPFRLYVFLSPIYFWRFFTKKNITVYVIMILIFTFIHSPLCYIWSSNHTLMNDWAFMIYSLFTQSMFKSSYFSVSHFQANLIYFISKPSAINKLDCPRYFRRILIVVVKWNKLIYNKNFTLFQNFIFNNSIDCNLSFSWYVIVFVEWFLLMIFYYCLRLGK